MNKCRKWLRYSGMGKALQRHKTNLGMCIKDKRLFNRYRLRIRTKQKKLSEGPTSLTIGLHTVYVHTFITHEAKSNLRCVKIFLP